MVERERTGHGGTLCALVSDPEVGGRGSGLLGDSAPCRTSRSSALRSVSATRWARSLGNKGTVDRVGELDQPQPSTL